MDVCERLVEGFQWGTNLIELYFKDMNSEA